jgi:hypothetical protein
MKKVRKYIVNKRITECETCPNLAGRKMFIQFCLGTKEHYVIESEDLKNIPDWCPLPEDDCEEDEMTKIIITDLNSDEL